ncbi:hypothetical protein AB7M56_002337 [Bradyrhizobium elkanii]|nr:hypothetical protein [Bradyrhizobium elkanii]MCS4072086.1 hypothetical protein [Bradyrhizobium elkanii]MCS4078719.1 hypothetical protein [Bradyrhizobium elkanii]MCW2122699.1 hypothetical protein [Bradyrhizobium elkanii]MCW2169446.1 hypothetical protein [Bradyrhizobium elkanii]
MNKRMGTDGGLSRFQPDGELTIWGQQPGFDVRHRREIARGLSGL